MYSDILTSIKTINDKRELEIALRQAQPSFNQPGVDVVKVVDQFIPIKFAKKLNFETFKDTDPEKYFLGLLTEIDNLEIINLTIAIDPTQQLIDTICEWLGKNLSQAPIVDFLVDARIGAGVKIEYKGKYEDLSAQSKIETFTNDKSI